MKIAPFFVAVALAGSFALATGGDAQASSHKFYKGKRISLIVGYTAGGGYDTYTRLLAQYMKKHIPGNPSIIVACSYVHVFISVIHMYELNSK